VVVVAVENTVEGIVGYIVVGIEVRIVVVVVVLDNIVEGIVGHIVERTEASWRIVVVVVVLDNIVEGIVGHIVERTEASWRIGIALASLVEEPSSSLAVAVGNIVEGIVERIGWHNLEHNLAALASLVEPSSLAVAVDNKMADILERIERHNLEIEDKLVVASASLGQAWFGKDFVDNNSANNWIDMEFHIQGTVGKQ